jgi:hypothetical protein
LGEKYKVASVGTKLPATDGFFFLVCTKSFCLQMCCFCFFIMIVLFKTFCEEVGLAIDHVPNYPSLTINKI